MEDYGIFKGKHEIEFAADAKERVTVIVARNGEDSSTIMNAVSKAFSNNEPFMSHKFTECPLNEDRKSSIELEGEKEDGRTEFFRRFRETELSKSKLSAKIYSQLVKIKFPLDPYTFRQMIQRFFYIRPELMESKEKVISTLKNKIQTLSAKIESTKIHIKKLEKNNSDRKFDDTIDFLVSLKSELDKEFSILVTEKSKLEERESKIQEKIALENKIRSDKKLDELLEFLKQKWKKNLIKSLCILDGEMVENFWRIRWVVDFIDQSDIDEINNLLKYVDNPHIKMGKFEKEGSVIRLIDERGSNVIHYLAAGEKLVLAFVAICALQKKYNESFLFLDFSFARLNMRYTKKFCEMLLNELKQMQVILLLSDSDYNQIGIELEEPEEPQSSIRQMLKEQMNVKEYKVIGTTEGIKIVLIN